MEFAYVVSAGSMSSLAMTVRDIAFPGYHIQERDGLNIGGGQYFKIYRGNDVAIVCSADYANRPSPRFNFLVYLQRPDRNRLASLVAQLESEGFEVRVDV